MKKEKEPPGANTELRGKTLLIVHTCTPKKKFVLQRLKKLGVKIVMLHFQKDWAAPFVDHWIISDLNNHKESIQQVEAFLKENKDIHLDGIVTFWEESVLLTSKLTDNFKLIGIPYSISRKTRNKFLFRQYCESIGLKTPKHAYIKKREDIDKIASHLSFPIVLKPVFGSSSAFVIKVDEEEDVAQTYDYIKKNITSHPDSAEWDSLDVYAEEYIDGEEVDIDMIIQNGKLKFWSMSDNYKTNEPFFVETGQSIPTSLPQGSQERLVNMAEETLEKLGIQNGVIHFEAKIDNDIPVPIEVNIRMGGDEVHSFVKGAWGVDLVDNAAKIACGVYIDRIQKSNKAKKFITGTYFLSPHSGILVQLDIDEKKIKKHSVEEFHFYKKIGDPVLVPPEGFEYMGWITASGENNNDAQENLKAALKYVDYKVAKYASTSALGKTKGKSKFSFTAINKDLILQAAKIENIKHSSLKTKQLHIGIIGNNKSHVAKDIEKILEKAGYHTTYFDFNNTYTAIESIKISNVDLLFNLSEKIHGLQTMNAHSAALLDLVQIPYTGSDSLTLALTFDSVKFKKILSYHDIPTPKWDYLYTLQDDFDETLAFPLIVKPILDRDALGHNHNTVAKNTKELDKAVHYAIETLKSPVVIEEYAEGDEFIVSILGNEDDIRILPLTQIVGSDRKIQSPPKNTSKKLLSLVTEIALDTYYIFDCRDYGQVNIRIDSHNNPEVISVHANPSLAQTAIFAQSAKVAKMKYIELIEEILRISIKRNISSTPYYQVTS